MGNRFEEASFRHAVAVTPHDTNGNQYDALYVGGAGNITLHAADDSASVAFNGVTAGTLLRVATRLVLATGTTATAIVGLRY